MNEKEGDPSMVWCRRTHQEYDVSKHMRCPYCYGSKQDVESKDRSLFCDFDPKHDPTCFGFPPDSTRYERG